ncbi:hypothetical protein [Rhodococcus spelaei]|nr:hypothetical protein [Rhodococcus spelaei]
MFGSADSSGTGTGTNTGTTTGGGSSDFDAILKLLALVKSITAGAVSGM